MELKDNNATKYTKMRKLCVRMLPLLLSATILYIFLTSIELLNYSSKKYSLEFNEQWKRQIMPSYNISVINVNKQIYPHGEEFTGITRKTGSEKIKRIVRVRQEGRKTKIHLVDIRSLVSLHYLPDYKNPCWKVPIESPPIRCIPYFYLIGCAKCGTTNLWETIVKHPQVADTEKETGHWINRRRFQGKPFHWYLEFFKTAVTKVKTKVDSTGFHPLIIGDGNPSLISFNDYWKLDPANARHLSEPTFTNANALYRLNPQAKIIAILRDPVKRLISEYNYFNSTKFKKSSEHFHSLVQHEIQQFKTCSMKHTLRHCVYIKHNESKFGRVWLGLYAVFLEDYYRVFPREQILVLSLETCSQDFALCLQRSYDFLEVAPIDLETIRVWLNQSEIANQGPSKVNMLDSTRRMAEQFYKPYNADLLKLMGPDFNYTYTNEVS